MDSVGIGLIGAGIMGQSHAQALQRVQEGRLVAVADISESLAQGVGAKFGAKSYGGIDQLLENKEVDAVIICTPEHLHREAAEAAFKAGKHVLLEKPIATTLEDADAILAARDRAGRKLMIGHVVRFEYYHREAKRMLTEGKIGSPVAVFARRFNTIEVARRMKGRASLMFWLGVHDFDLLRWFAGAEATRVSAENHHGVLQGEGLDVEDHVFTLVHFANGVIGCAEHGWIEPVTHPESRDFKLDIQGAKGQIYIDSAHPGIAIASPEEWRTPAAPMLDAVAEECRSLSRCIMNNEKTTVTGEDGRAALEIALASIQSAKEGRSVSLPLKSK